MSKGKLLSKDLMKQADEILELASQDGVQKNFFFVTTFERYLTLIKMMDKLKAQMKEDGYTVEKEYVKGRKNIYVHPAMAQYNTTARNADGTVKTLMRIIKEFKDDGATDSALLKFLKGK